MSCIATLSNVHELVILQHHAVHVTSRSCSMLRIFVIRSPDDAAAVIANSFSIFPTFLIFRSLDPHVIVSYMIAFCLVSLFRSEEVVDFILQSFFWSSYGSVDSGFCAEVGVPFRCFPCPSFLWHYCYSHRQSPFHSFVCFML